MKKSPYAMCYFHIGDLFPESSSVMSKEAFEAYFKEPGTFKARYLHYIKNNYGKKNAMQKLMRLIDETKFFDLRQADDEIDWSSSVIVKL